MNDVMQDRPQAPPQLLAWCLGASFVLHAVAFWGLPGWHRNAEIAPATVLNVVMVKQAAAPERIAPPEPPPRIPRRVEPRPQPVSREPVRQPAAVAAPLPDPEPAISISATAEPQLPVVAATKPAATVAAAPVAVPVTPPRFNAAYLRNPAPPYPAAARRRGDEGTVMLKVLVSAEGAPLRVELDQTSGSNPLDGAALDAVKGWRFVPARRGEQNVEGWVRVPVVFRLES